MSIARAQAQAIADGFLDNVSSAKPKDNELPAVEAILSLAAKVFLDTAAANLQKTNTVASGHLSSDLTFFIEHRGSTYELSVGYPPGSKAAEYYDYINQGVKGFSEDQSGSTGKYAFKNTFPSKKMATAILLWYRLAGKQVANIKPHKKQSNLDTKRHALKSKISGADSLKGLTYATATNIKKRGIKATHFFDDTIESVFNQQLSEALSVALAADVRLQIRKYGDNS